MSEPEYWRAAQSAELQVWDHARSSPTEVLSELLETSELVDFGRRNGTPASLGAVIELGVGPFGVGWAAFGESDLAVGVDPLPRLHVNTGVDALDKMVGILQQRSKYLQADASKPLPFEPSSFDLIVCDNVLDHTQNPRDVLLEARRLVKADGAMLFGVNVFSVLGLTKWRYVTRRLYPHASNTICHPHSFTGMMIERILSDTGWHIRSYPQPSHSKRLLGRAYRARLVAAPHEPPVS